MEALILAAGYARRLYPLTREFPKPLLKVGRRPIIDYILGKLQQISEIDRIIVVTNSKFLPHFKKWVRGLRVVKKITLVDDLTRTLASRRGAIGDMEFAIKNARINDDLLIVGGDNLFDGDLREFVRFARKKKHSPVIGAYRLPNSREAGKYGVIRLDSSGRITDFQEKPKKPRSRLVAMCVYYLPKETLGLVREYMKIKNRQDATGFYIDWLRHQAAVYGFVFRGRWYDIGDYKFYNQAKINFATNITQ